MKNKWIPVEERLPKKGQEVLVSLSNGDVTTDFFDLYKNIGYYFVSFLDDEISVLAWMPLPEPYEQEVGE